MRRLLQPRWIVMHVLVLLLVVVMVNLGFWQLRRLDERRDRNDLIESRLALPAEPVGDLVDPGDGADVTDQLRFRPATASGTYTDVATSVRTSQDGVSGAWIVTELDLGGEVVPVLRGFAGLDPDGSIPEVPAPSGEVDVDGIVVPTARLPRPLRTAIGQLASPDGLLPVTVQATDADDPLTPVPLPELGEGPHLSYAVQWFLFSAIGVVGYPLVVQRRLREPDDGEPTD